MGTGHRRSNQECHIGTSSNHNEDCLDQVSGLIRASFALELLSFRKIRIAISAQNSLVSFGANAYGKRLITLKTGLFVRALNKADTGVRGTPISSNRSY